MPTLHARDSEQRDPCVVRVGVRMQGRDEWQRLMIMGPLQEREEHEQVMKRVQVEQHVPLFVVFD